MIWLLYFPLMCIIMVVCYLTNPIVVLFCDENGELPGFLKYWQTWDDSCDSRYMMTSVIPKSKLLSWLDYGWAEKYDWYYDDSDGLKELGCIRERTKLKDGVSFSVAERFKRYVCRTLWLTRNCAYGFAFWVFGRDGKIEDLVFHKRIEESEFNEHVDVREDKERLSTRKWSLRFYKHVVGPLYITGYLGWKIPFWKESGKYHAMIANRIVPRFKL